MHEPATAQDIEYLRADIGVLRKTVDDAKADTRDRLNRHSDEDDRRFGLLNDKIQEVEKLFAEWTGALGIAKWALGLGIPAIVGLLVTHLVRHW